MSAPVPPVPPVPHVSVLGTINGFFKTIQSVIIMAIVVLIAAAIWKVWLLFDSQLASVRQELVKAEKQIVQLKTENEQLVFANTLLKKQRQLAIISNVSSQTDESGMLKTTFTFTEVDDFDTPVTDPIVYTIEGNELYIDTLVIKFEDKFIESNDNMRGVSLCMIRRLFSSKIAPENGLHIQRDSFPFIGKNVDTNVKESREFQQKMWLDFWKLANDPEVAHKQGIRAAQGSASSQRIDPGKRYKLEVRNTGELTFVPIAGETSTPQVQSQNPVVSTPVTTAPTAIPAPAPAILPVTVPAAVPATNQ